MCKHDRDAKQDLKKGDEKKRDNNNNNNKYGNEEEYDIINVGVIFESGKDDKEEH